MSTNRLPPPSGRGQSLWLDGLCRQQLPLGDGLEQLVERAGVRGVTADPAMHERAICETPAYDEAIGRLARQSRSAEQIYETLLGEDARWAADILRPVYEDTGAEDGFVCLPVAPTLADNSQGLVAEARRWWARLRRPNVMLMVPATREGLPAIQQLVSEGINVNATLLFSAPRYEEVAAAYVAGLQRRLARGRPLAPVQAVASFSLRPITDLLDRQLERVMRAAGPEAELALQLHGRIAAVQARLAYQSYQTITATPRWQRLASAGAHPPRLLWADLDIDLDAGRGRGDAALRGCEFADTLSDADTIRALAPEALAAYRAGVRPGAGRECGVATAERRLNQLREVRIDLTAGIRRLEDQGVRELQLRFHRLLATLEDKRRAAAQWPLSRRQSARCRS